MLTYQLKEIILYLLYIRGGGAYTFIRRGYVNFDERLNGIKIQAFLSPLFSFLCSSVAKQLS